jgi:hypothetical protein
VFWFENIFFGFMNKQRGKKNSPNQTQTRLKPRATELFDSPSINIYASLTRFACFCTLNTGRRGIFGLLYEKPRECRGKRSERISIYATTTGFDLISERKKVVEVA